MEKRKIIWLDGSVDKEVPGKLLSDNNGFYGDCVLTGAKYRYLTELTGIGDTAADMPEFTGRRLLDGWLAPNYRKMPAKAKDKMTVEFDFISECVFTEVDFYCVTEIQGVEISVSKDGENFLVVSSELKHLNMPLYRNTLKESVAGRYLRLSIKAEKVELFQVWVWGDRPQSASEKDLGTEDFVLCNSVSMQSLMGVKQTAFTDLTGFKWTKKLKAAGLDKCDAVFSKMPAYDALSSAPILPEVDNINGGVKTRICQNGTGVACVALTNTNMQFQRNIEVVLENDTPLKAELFVAGVMPSRWYGDGVVTLFNEKFDIAKPLKYKYVLNAPVIADFPTIHLPAGGSCIFWVRVYGENNVAGKYNLTLKAGGSSFNIEVEVLPIKLERPKTAVFGWGSRTNMIPFTFEDRIDNELKSRKEVGINVYRYWPEKGPAHVNVGYIQEMGAEAIEKDEYAQFIIDGFNEEVRAWLMSGEKTHENLTPEMQEKIMASVEDNIAHAKRLGLRYDQWLIDFPDEPSDRNIRGMGKVVELIKKKHPEVRLYMNPAFWVGFRNGAVASDEVQTECIKDWYHLIDMSVPLVLNLEERPKVYEYYTQEREFNGLYNVVGQHVSGDRRDMLNLARENTWDAIARDMNCWGIYAYSALRFDNWNNVLCPHIDRDVGTINYQAVYPGKDAPIPTRAYELMREGYEDYMIMAKLKEKDLPLYRALQQEYLSGCTDFERFRETAIDALLKD